MIQQCLLYYQFMYTSISTYILIVTEVDVYILLLDHQVHQVTKYKLYQSVMRT